MLDVKMERLSSHLRTESKCQHLWISLGPHRSYEILEKEEVISHGCLGVEGWRLVRKTSLRKALAWERIHEQVEQGKGQPTHTLLIPIVSFSLSQEHIQGHSWWGVREDGEWWSCDKLEGQILILLKHSVGKRKQHRRWIPSWEAMLQPLEREETLSWELGAWVLVLVLSFPNCGLG